MPGTTTERGETMQDHRGAPADTDLDDLSADETLIEEVSIDGMCGVY